MNFVLTILLCKACSRLPLLSVISNILTVKLVLAMQNYILADSFEAGSHSTLQDALDVSLLYAATVFSLIILKYVVHVGPSFSVTPDTAVFPIL